MKEKIYKYLLEEQEKITAGQILEIFFYTFDRHVLQAEKIVDSILSGDARFVKEESGVWSVKKQEEIQRLKNTVFSIIDFKTIPVGNKKELPVLIAIAQVQNSKMIYKRIFSIDIPIKISGEIQNRREALISSIEVDGNLISNLDTIYVSLTNSILVNDLPYKTMDRLNWFFRQNGKFDLDIEKINLKNLAKRLIPDHKNKIMEDIADGLNISFNSPLNFSERLYLIIDMLVELLNKLKQKNIESIEDLSEFLSETVEWINFSDYNFNQQFIRDLPPKPGIYLMKNRDGEIFYVGKSKNLKSRVESYFINKTDIDEKEKKILKEIYDLQIETVGSELDALLLENRYINLYQPKLNKQFKIHHLKKQKFINSRIILFMPSGIKNKINLFFINGIYSVSHYTLEKDKSNFNQLKKSVQQFFFAETGRSGLYNSEQIEIILRWLDMNKNNINFFDVDECGTLDKCLEIIRRYISDNKLFLEKIHHC